jgi:prepilin-type processing-associated H-X9-DG protein
MRKVFLILIFLFYNFFLFSQTIRLGADINFLTGYKYYNFLVGPSVLAEYGFQKVPLTIKVSCRLFFISELNENYLPGYTNNCVGAGVSLNYFPVKWDVQPYFGLGLFYYSNSIKQGGNASFVDGHINYIRNEDNNISVELTGGIKFSAYSPINFIIELTQTFSKQADLISQNPETNSIIEKQKISIFNSLFIRGGILFRI